MGKRWIWLVVLIGGVAFSAVLGFSLLDWDDNQLLINNPWVQPRSFGDIWRVWDPLPALQSKVLEYFPLRDLCYATLYFFWGLHPFPYHLLNWLLHLLNIGLVFVLLSRLLKQERPALLAALFFALHPVHVEMVAWVSALKGLQMTSFTLLGAIAFLAYLRGQRRAVWWALACVVLACLSKHVGVITAGFYGLLGLWSLLVDERGDSVEFKPTLPPTRQRANASEPESTLSATRQRAKTPMDEAVSSFHDRLLQIAWPIAVGLLFGLIYGLFSLEIGKGHMVLHGVASTASTSGPSALLILPWAQAQNALRLLWPLHLMPMYPPPSLQNGLTLGWWGALCSCLVALGALGWMAHKRLWRPLFAVAWLALGLSPFVFFQVGEQWTADRYLYLPSVGFCWLLALALEQLWRRGAKVVYIALILFLCGLYGWGLWDYLPMWKNPDAFWAGFLRRAPRQKAALVGVANRLMRKNKPREALKYYRALRRYHGFKAVHHADYSVALLLAGQPKQALTQVQLALRRYPRSAKVLNAAGFILGSAGKHQASIRYFLQATKRNPRLYQAHLNLLRALFILGRIREGFSYGRRLLRRPLPQGTRRVLFSMLQRAQRLRQKQK